MSTRITLSNLTKQFPAASGLRAKFGGKSGPAGRTSAPAVDHVSLTIEPGELFLLLGPSGCGKTTLLRMIAGFIDPTDGEIRFTTADGGSRDVTHLPPNKRNTGMVFQSYALWPHMTVEANVAFGLSVRKVPAEERRRRALEALDMVRMGEYAARKPNQLSGGQQQRVALARALVIRPDVLLLDEPLSNLDAKLRIELRSEIRRICKESRAGSATDAGMTTVYVTHDQKEALSMADRVAIMRSGRIVQVGTPEELYRAPRTRFVAEFLGETNFIEGTVRGVDPASGSTGLVTIETPAGTLRGTPGPGLTAAPGQKVVCSVRPEAIRVLSNGTDAPGLTPTASRLSARVLDSTYLGEMIQHTIEAHSAASPGGSGGSGGSGGVRLKAAVFNPHITWNGTGAAREVTAAIDPADVIVLAE